MVNRLGEKWNYAKTKCMINRGRIAQFLNCANRKCEIKSLQVVYSEIWVSAPTGQLG